MNKNKFFATQWFPDVFVGIVAIVIIAISIPVFYILVFPFALTANSFSFFLQLFWLLLLLSLFFWQKKELYSEITFRGWFSWEDYKLCMLVYLAIFCFSELVAFIFDMPPELFMEILFAGKKQDEIFVICVGLIVFTPISEEILFRHFILAIFPFNRGGKWAVYAILFSSVFFAILHTQYNNVSTYIYLFNVGVLLALARIISQGLLLPILLHASFNTIALFLFFISN